MQFLEHIDLSYIQFTNNTDYWQANSFKQIFQNATTFFQLGGTEVNVYGGGMLGDNGQLWYDLYAKDIYTLRPILFGIIGLDGGSVSNLRLRYSPQWFVSLQYSHSNTVVNNGDDCVSFKPNATEILVQNMHCTGSHGISVGSLGQYVGEVDIVQNVLVDTMDMSNASDGARIEVWPDSSAALSGDLQGGGGSGRVKNIIYRNYEITNVDYAIEVTQCYGQDNITLCNEYPSNLTISDVNISNFKGTTSDEYDPVSGYVVCSSSEACSTIEVRNAHVVSPSGVADEFVCWNVDESLLHGIDSTALLWRRIVVEH
ncbi:hypothetical protein LTR37_013046 [Vermiconidia calcicola]|uniref:Uncharacterized protein n=1 Tax=Vermiconidia calcicola TaxID=1690605 RepID=A0ACC3MXH8_9PEZI|nr:hypothetical protein LTR37_013046 [Vermiconidia calcicola]